MPQQSPDLSNSDQHQNSRWTILLGMRRRVSSDRHRRNGAGIVGARKNGRRFNVSVTVSPIRDAEGRVVGASSIGRDITHHKEAEAATRERDTLRYVASLAAAAAHEINNPLAVIMGYAQLLADKVDAQGRGQIDEILEALSRIQEIVMRMKRVTRIELTEEVLYLPEMLDLSRSSEPGLPLPSQAPGAVSMASDRRS
jgi:signal transduction histidine kinase